MQIKFLLAGNSVFQRFRFFSSSPHLSPLISAPCAPSDLCQDAHMKQFFLGYLLSALIIPTLSIAQTAQLTEHLGRTVLYGDIALSPDGSHVAWVQSTAATTSKLTYIQATSGNSSAALVNLKAAGERINADPAWSPDAKTVAFLSIADEKGQRQLWLVNANGSNPRKLSELKGYAARPRWSHDGRQIAFLYIEDAGGGGPFIGGPRITGGDAYPGQNQPFYRSCH